MNLGLHSWSVIPNMRLHIVGNHCSMQVLSTHPALSGEVKYGHIAVAMNETFHAVDPVRYSEEDWHQIKAKDNNMRAKVRDIVGA